MGMNRTSPAWCIGSEAKLPGSKETTKVPGPGNYDYMKGAGAESPKWGIGTGQRGNLALVKSVPGPGNYTHKDTADLGPKYTFGGKRNDGSPKPVDVNGPGAYNPD